MGNKNKNNKFTLQDKSETATALEYDLTQSLKRVRPYSRHTKKGATGERTYSDEEQSSQSRKGLVSSNSSQFENKTTGVPSWDRYDRLEDRFTSYSDKNEKEHTALRQELEGKIEKSTNDIKNEVKDLSQKIDKKLSKQWYVWTIVTLVAIVGLIWALSYQEIIKIPNEIIKIENRINNIENEMKEGSVK